MEMKKIYITFHILHKYSTYQIINDPCNGKQCQYNISSCGETTDHTKHDT